VERPLPHRRRRRSSPPERNVHSQIRGHQLAGPSPRDQRTVQHAELEPLKEHSVLRNSFSPMRPNARRAGDSVSPAKRRRGRHGRHRDRADGVDRVGYVPEDASKARRKGANMSTQSSRARDPGGFFASAEALVSGSRGQRGERSSLDQQPS
jgi:hypothetical protein